MLATGGAQKHEDASTIELKRALPQFIFSALWALILELVEG